MGVNSLPKTVTRQRRGCDLNPGPCAPDSSTLTTRLPSHPLSPYVYDTALQWMASWTDLMLRTAFRPSVSSCHYDIVRNFTDFQSDASGGPYDGRHVLDLYVRLCVRACVRACRRRHFPTGLPLRSLVFSVRLVITRNWCNVGLLLYIGWSDVIESMVTIRSPFCGWNTAKCMELKGEDLSCYSDVNWISLV